MNIVASPPRKSLPDMPLMVFLACCLLYVILVYQTFGMLPERVASHFNAEGIANGWMPRELYGRFVLLFGLGMGLLPLAIGLLMNILPSWTFNLPNREYWLSPGRRMETVAWLQRHMIWFSCLLVAFFAAIHLQVCAANLAPDGRMTTGDTIMLLGGFVITMIVWSAVLLLKFRKPA